MPITQLEDVLAVDEVARYLRIHPMTVQRWCRTGDLPAVKIGRAYRTRQGDLERWWAQHSARGKEHNGSHDRLEDLEDAPEAELSEAEERIVDQASAARTIAELQVEVASVKRLEELARAVRRLAEAFQPDRIYVFGSQARGTAGPDNDIDLLVVVPAAAEPTYRLASAIASLPGTVLREGRLLYAA